MRRHCGHDEAARRRPTGDAGDRSHRPPSPSRARRAAIRLAGPDRRHRTQGAANWSLSRCRRWSSVNSAAPVPRWTCRFCAAAPARASKRNCCRGKSSSSCRWTWRRTRPWGAFTCMPTGPNMCTTTTRTTTTTTHDHEHTHDVGDHTGYVETGTGTDQHSGEPALGERPGGRCQPGVIAGGRGACRQLDVVTRGRQDDVAQAHAAATLARHAHRHPRGRHRHQPRCRRTRGRRRHRHLRSSTPAPVSAASATSMR